MAYKSFDICAVLKYFLEMNLGNLKSNYNNLAHELWAAAQLTPGEGIEDGVNRVVGILESVQRSQDLEDAERYRTLVESGHFVPASIPYFNIWGLRTTGRKATKKQLDEAVDIARRNVGNSND